MSGAIATANLDAGVIKGALTGTLTCAGQGTIGSLEVWGDVSGEISAVQDENEGSGGIGSLIIGGTLSGTIDSASLTNVSIRNVSSNALVLGGLEVVLGEGGIAQNGGRFVELGGAPVALYASVGAITADDTGRWHWTQVHEHAQCLMGGTTPPGIARLERHVVGTGGHRTLGVGK